ncbi:MAG TPA: hypothetical protein VF467_11580, partial [Afipia sp.]
VLWALKGHPGAMRDVRMTAKTHEQWISATPFAGAGRRSVCTPSRTVIETVGGEILQQRDNPRDAFAGYTTETKWDDLNLAYFTGYAMWNYLNAPFIFTLPGFKTEEIESWQEDGETRRRLKVTFPDDIATHCPEQTFHINAEGLIVRMDYSALVTGGIPAAHYLHDHKIIDGLVLPMRRRVLRLGSSGNGNPEPLIIGIDFQDIVIN